ncbi:hypothetical protein F5Y18DRAFT_268217 [Xylariaceae sp. FL1019]|nr:hypothetical protein F5Y18DRAFT_268217 [Xylariaceae sp. FL1019]
MSWAGKSFSDTARATINDTLIDTTHKTFQAIHELKSSIAEPHDVLYNAHSDTVRTVDFERAELLGRVSLGVIDSDRKGKHTHPGKRNKDEFQKELLCIATSIQRYIQAKRTIPSKLHD